jgi:hypothetical protein
MSLENPQRPSEEFKLREAIGFIEAMNIGSEPRAQMILVLLNLKPAFELGLYPWNASPEDVEASLNKTDLKYIKREKPKQQKTIAEYAVSREKELAEKLINCESSAEYGTLMGYPETAIQAYEAREVYTGPLPEDIKNSIFKLKFSNEHFREEFEIVRKWNTALLEYAPNLVQHYRDIR